MDIRKQITDFKPFNDQEAQEQKTILKWMDTFDNLLSRENEFAHFTSSAIVVNHDRTKMLMAYHNIYDAWAWTGGHADGDSNLLAVALREITEETGVTQLKPLSHDIYLLDILGVDGHLKNGKYVASHLHLSVAYLIEANETETLVVNAAENSGVRWFPLEEIVAITPEPNIKKLYQKAFDKLKLLK